MVKSRKYESLLARSLEWFWAVGDDSSDDVVGECGGDAQDEALHAEAGEAEGAEEEGAVAAALWGSIQLDIANYWVCSTVGHPQQKSQ